MASLRSAEMKKKFAEYRENSKGDIECQLCIKPSLNDFTHWRIVENSFPYDLIAKEHQMIVPRRHVPESGLIKEELDEFMKIKEEFINSHFDYIIEATPKNKSIPEHFHLHLIVGKE